MTFANRAWLFLFALTFCSTFALSSFAESSPYRSTAYLDHSKISTESIRSGNGRPRRDRIAPLVVATRVRGIGHVRFKLDTRIHKDWRATIRNLNGEHTDTVDPVLLQGDLIVGHGSFSKIGKERAAAGIIKKSLRFSFERTDRRGRTRYYSLDVSLSGATPKVKIASVPHSFAKTKSCGIKEAHSRPKSSSLRAQIPAINSVTINTASREMEIATDFDGSWFTRFGSQANAEIALRINQADIIYQRDFDLGLRIVAQNGYQTAAPYTSRDASTLLNDFRNNTDRTALRASSDVQIAFIGDDLNGSTIGIAYVDVICQFGGTFSYGVIQFFSSTLDRLILAHEMGHSLSLEHSSGIMNSSLNGADAFIQGDINIVKAYQQNASTGFCLTAPQSATPTPTATPSATPTVTPTATNTPEGDSPAPPPEDPDDPDSPSAPDPTGPQPAIQVSSVKQALVTRRSGRSTSTSRRVTIKGSVFDDASGEAYSGVPVQYRIGGVTNSVSSVTKANGRFSGTITLANRRATSIQAFATVTVDGVSSTIESSVVSLRRITARSR